MAFTEHSDLFGSVHEDGINLVIRHIMRQRPSLFNYATPAFHANPGLFCEPIEAAPTVLAAGNPLFTEQEPLPIFGAPVPLGLNFCLQLRDLEIDFHPTNVFDLPEELGSKLSAQRFAIRARACAGLDCPSDDLIDQLVEIIERLVVAQRRESEIKSQRDSLSSGQTGRSSELALSTDQPSLREVNMAARTLSTSTLLANLPMFSQPPAGTSTAMMGTTGATTGIRGGSDRPTIPLPTRALVCFCIELFVVGHFEWGTVGGGKQQWFKPRVDGVEIVDIAPTPMENALECYAMTVLRLGILPRLMLPMEKMVLDITEVMQKQGLNIGQQVDLGPSAVPADVPNNPAIEEDQVKVFVKVTVTP